MTTRSHKKIALKVPVTTKTASPSTGPVVTPVATPPTAIAAPVTTSSSVVKGMTVPVVTLPPIPDSFVPVDLATYRGTHPRQLQLAAVPNAVAEINNTAVYKATLGPAAPDGPLFAETLDTAMGWTTLRAAIEAFLEYVKSQEAVSWKAGMTLIDEAKAGYEAVLAQNASIVHTLPALARLLDVGNLIAKKSSATRKRNKAAAVATATTAQSAQTESAPTPVAPAATSPSTTTPNPTTGGSSH